MMNDNIILDLKGIGKSFPGVKALDQVTFQVRKGDIHALVGENGAGKSTLIKILTGIYTSDTGSFSFKGEDVHIKSPLEAQKLGMSVVHQELKLVETLSVAENIFLGRPLFDSDKLVSWKKMRERAQELLNSVNANIDCSTQVQKLSVAQKQLVEICKALSFHSELIIMDEPSATLTEKELGLLFDIMRMLKQRGVTIIYISHRLEEVFELADRITVLRDGMHVKTMDTCEVDRKGLISLMVGRELGNEYPKAEIPLGEVLFEVKNLNRNGVLHDINFQLRKGEILGIAGLVGAGRTEVARAIFGADKKDSGQLFVHGKEVKINTVRDAIRQKIGLVPEDRKQQGLILNMTVKHNTSLVGIQNIMNRFHAISNRKERQMALEYIKALHIATPDEERAVKNLSGGNQQKVVLAKWLAVDSDILIFDEPTRGIDVGAKAEIYKLLGKMAEQGKGVIMISSEMPEIIGMCDRILIMHDGKMTGEILRKDATQESIMSYATM